MKLYDFKVTSFILWLCCEVVTTLVEVDEMRNRQEGCYHSTGLITKIQSARDRKLSRGLHKNTSHAYSQDVLSFMLGREGKSVHTGNKTKKRNKTTQNGKKVQ